jgi:hypothetical protein
MKKVIRLTENDLVRVIKKVINEQEEQKETQIWKDIYLDLSDFKSPRRLYDEKRNLLVLFWGMKNPFNVKDSKNSFKGGWNLTVADGELEFYVENFGRDNPSPYGESLRKEVTQLINKYGFKSHIYGSYIVLPYSHELNIKNAPKIVNLVREILTSLPEVKPSDADREFARSKSKFDGY